MSLNISNYVRVKYSCLDGMRLGFEEDRESCSECNVWARLPDIKEANYLI